MYAMTVHRPPQRVNTLVRVTAKETPGTRLKGYIRMHWTRRMGGDTALAKKAGVRRQTLQEWYAGASVPRLTELDVVAKAMGVRRVDLVAAYDGVTAPETKKEPPPEWAGALVTYDALSELSALIQSDLTAEVRANRKAIDAAARTLTTAAQALGHYVAQISGTPPLGDGAAQVTDAPKPRVRSRPQRQRSKK